MKTISLLFLALFIYMIPVMGQGCSDAGLCTMDSFKPHTDEAKMTHAMNQIKIGLNYGRGDNSIGVFGQSIEYNRQFSHNFGMDFRVTSVSQSGNGISKFGLSDLFVSGSYNTGGGGLITAGVKIPLSKSDAREGDVPLPMDYQASLGTYDLILGYGRSFGKFQVVLGYQQPLSDNKNAFFPSLYPGNPVLFAIQTTNSYKRAGDVLLRVSYPFRASDNVMLTASVLPIYHLANDKYTDAFGAEREITGSQGLTLNMNLFADIMLSATSSVQVSFGMPFVTRDARPDGLTRKFVAGAEYRVRF
ncbi:MAG: hypothetical protein L6Q59_15710 [Ignavibacteriaceae bacterium]|nr:hypothetical protein [Ignavibacteriaceae bacterium]